MTERTNLAKSIAEAKCLGSLVAIDTAHKAGDLTDAEKDRLLSGLVPLHESHNREVAELVRLVCEPPPGPGVLVKSIDFTKGERGDLSIYGPGNNERWGQNIKKLADGTETCQRTGWYHPSHARQEADGIHLDLLPDPRTVAGKPGWKCWSGVTSAPREFRAEVDASLLYGDGAWHDCLWATSQPFGWSGIEADHMETFGAPKGKEGHQKFVTATHIGFDGLASKPMLNVEPKLLGRSHTHDAVYGDHTFWMQIVENQTGDGFLITRGIDTATISTLDTAEFHAKGYFIRGIFPGITGWNVYLMTEASGEHAVKPLVDAVILRRFRLWDPTGEGK